MARTKRTHKSLASPGSAAAREHIANGPRGTLVLFATLALSLATAIAAAAWLIVTTESPSVTNPTTATYAHATPPVAAPAAAAQHRAQPPAVPAVPSTPAAPSAAGQRAFIDPVTGALRQPEHDELAALAAEAAAAAPARRSAARTASTAVEFGPDGSVTAVVPEDLHTFTVATRGPDGRIVIEHAQGAANAAKLVKANSAKKGPRAAVSRAQKEDRNDR